MISKVKLYKKLYQKCHYPSLHSFLFITSRQLNISDFLSQKISKLNILFGVLLFSFNMFWISLICVEIIFLLCCYNHYHFNSVTVLCGCVLVNLISLVCLDI